MNPIRHVLIGLFAALALVAAPSVGAQSASPATLVEGQDYVSIPQGAPFANAKGKIEIAEVFSYACHHCNDFQPMVDGFKAKLPADVDFVYVPATFDPNDPLARAFLAARQLKLSARVHNDLFRAIHAERSLPFNPTESELAEFHTRYGVSATAFVAAMNSRVTAAQMRLARQFIETANINGTPMLVVAGKYRVLGNSKQDALRIAAQLAAQERAARRR